MTRRDFLQQCAALAGALALPTAVLAREVPPPDYFAILHAGRRDVGWQPWPLQAYRLDVVAGEQAGAATLRRGADLLLRVVAGPDSFGGWFALPDCSILWSPDLRLKVTAGAAAALLFQDRVLFASADVQRWCSTVRLP